VSISLVVIGLVGASVGLILIAVGLVIYGSPSERRRRAEPQRELLLSDLRMRRLAQAAVLRMLQATHEQR
jgi:hypothetical protein